MFKKLWESIAPDGEVYYGNGESDETRRAAQRDERHRTEVKTGQAAKAGQRPLRGSSDGDDEPIIVNGG